MTPVTNRMAPYRANQEKRGRISALLISLEDQIEDAIAIASIREQVRTLGIDRVRGL